MKATPTHWTDDRVEDFELLKRLLIECQSLDSANRTIDRLQNLIAWATQLTSTDYEMKRMSFTSFLTDRICDDRFPGSELASPAPARPLGSKERL